MKWLIKLITKIKAFFKCFNNKVQITNNNQIHIDYDGDGIPDYYLRYINEPKDTTELV